MLELLSPAGSMQALRAAVCNGADAVYLGAGSFNARANARNFTPEELDEAVRYCHVRGVKVHLTLNTLVSDRELGDAAELIARAARANVDAFIVQDLGIVSLCRRIAPHIALHASTQMSIHSLEGVRRAAELGLSRVVLARELPMRDIAHICRNSPVEIEVFVHGALCMCVSGQCYMSGVIGRRSGNRGQCAQPCRLPYGYDRYEEKYPLSLKDQCLIDKLKELEAMGVASLKIEGRMKRPEYVATVTGIYRSALDRGRVSDEQRALLKTAFSRQGFTQGYYLGKTGASMLGTRQKEPEDKAFLQAVRASYENVEPQRVDVCFYAVVALGRGVMLAVRDKEGNVCKAEGAVPEIARSRALTQQELAERLAKTGGTPYRCAEVRSVVGDNLSVSASEINRLRREVLTQLTALRGRCNVPELGKYAAQRRFAGSKSAPELTVSVYSRAQITPKLCKLRPAVLYVPLHVLLESPDFFRALGAAQTLAAILPRVVQDHEQAQLLQKLDCLAQLGVKRVLAGNLGQIEFARARGLEVAGDFGLNLYNSAAMAQAQKLGLASATASFEMTLAQIRDLSKPIPTELIAYGRLPLMLTENCLIRNRTGDCACGGTVRLIDRIGEEFRLLREADTCRTVIYNGKKLWMLDKQKELSKLGLWALRLSFTTENSAEVDAVLAAWQSDVPFDSGKCTRGLYLRGVE